MNPIDEIEKKCFAVLGSINTAKLNEDPELEADLNKRLNEDIGNLAQLLMGLLNNNHK